VDLRETECERADWTQLARDRVQWLVILHPPVPCKAQNILTGRVTTRM